MHEPATALQTVDLRAQVTSTIRDVHIIEGQTVAKGDLLFSLDSRADDANIRKAEAQVEKDKADLATAQAEGTVHSLHSYNPPKFGRIQVDGF